MTGGCNVTSARISGITYNNSGIIDLFAVRPGTFNYF
jgi:hypothetical protein